MSCKSKAKAAKQKQIINGVVKQQLEIAVIM